MTILVVGGAGFIGRRMIPKLVNQGHDVVCADINFSLAAQILQPLAPKVRMVRADVTQFDDMVRLVHEVKPKTLINLSYFIGSDMPPHVATKLNVVGMDNCFEAARLGGVAHTVFASSLAVSGQQKNFGERLVNEDDPKYGTLQYAFNKIFNEFQAQDYREKYGMTITCVRPANVTGPDKVDGSIDHVRCMVLPARGQPVSFPYADATRCPIHVDDIAEVFARVAMKDKPNHTIYNSGGHTISMGDLAKLVRGYLPDAKITFEHETGGKDASGNYLIDNSRLVQEFELQYPPFAQRVREIINTVRREEGLPAV
jgi:nucleoside-diphosphate-sugar epimerase